MVIDFSQIGLGCNPDDICNNTGTMYILKHRKPVRCKKVLEWGRWYEGKNNRRVRTSWFNDNLTSTVFLGIDHDFTRSNEPILFETMIFYSEHSGIDNDVFARCSTWREALKNHKAAKNEMIKKGV